MFPHLRSLFGASHQPGSRCRRLLKRREEELIAQVLAGGDQEPSQPLQSFVASVPASQWSSSINDDHSSHQNTWPPQRGSPMSAMQDALLESVHDIQQVLSAAVEEMEAIEMLIFKVGDGVKHVHTPCASLLQEYKSNSEMLAKKLHKTRKHMESSATDGKLSRKACRRAESAPLPSLQEVDAILTACAKKGIGQPATPPIGQVSSTADHTKNASIQATGYRNRNLVLQKSDTDFAGTHLTAKLNGNSAISYKDGGSCVCSQCMHVHMASLQSCNRCVTIHAMQGQALPHIPVIEEAETEGVS